VLRTIGTKSAIVVLALDVLKGVTAVFIGHYVIGSPTGEMAAGFAAVAGHDWSIFLRFKGGRGVATTLGCVLAMEPLGPVAGIVVFVILVALTRYVSLGSICGSLAAVAVLGAFWAMDRVPWQYFTFTAVAVALIIFQHRDNISRLLAGTENKLGHKGEKRQS
jgi:glycerol-3-phosphate acyltransferase PlsY